MASSEIYESRAKQYQDAMSLLHDDLGSYSSAVCLLAVHSAIAFNDAVQVKLLGRRSSFDSHKGTIEKTRKACGMLGKDAEGLKHLKVLLDMKSPVSYGGDFVTPAKAATAKTHADRFAAWALKTIAEKK